MVVCSEPQCGHVSRNNVVSICYTVAMSLKLVLLYAVLPLVLYPCHKLWSRAIVQTTCTYDDLTLTSTQISTVGSWIRLMGLVK